MIAGIKSLVGRVKDVVRGVEVTDIFGELGQRHATHTLMTLQEPIELCSIGSELTGADIRDAGYRIANALRAVPGWRKNNRVIVAKKNHPDYFLYLHATIRAGGIPVSVNAATGWGFISSIQKLTGASFIITDDHTLARGDGDPALRDALDSIGMRWLIVSPGSELPERRANVIDFASAVEAASSTEPPARPMGDDTPLIMFHTSGTTGIPKCCVWTRRNAGRIWRIMSSTMPIGPSSRAMTTSPYSHALYFALQTAVFLVGAPTYAVSKFDPADCLRAIERRRITHYMGFPYTYMRMAAEDPSRYDLSSMKIWSTGADKAHAVHIEKFIAQGALRFGGKSGSLFLDSYGSTEIGAGGIMKIWSPWNRPVPCLQGKPMPTQFAYRVVDQDWNDLPDGQIGRVLVRSSTRFAGYWDNHEKWMQDHIDGWWFAGDVGYRDRRGNLFFLDREVDSVRTEHGVLYGLPVEERVLGDERVMEASVYQEHDQAVVVAIPKGCIESTAHLSDSEIETLRRELLELANRGIGPLEPAVSRVDIISLAELPLGCTGKVKKRDLRSRAQSTTRKRVANG